MPRAAVYSKDKRFKPRYLFPFWDKVEYLLLRALVALFNRLPASLIYALARILGRLLFWAMPKRRKIALHNLKLAMAPSKSAAELKKIAQGSFESAVFSALEFFRIPKMLPKAKYCFSHAGLEHVEKALEKGKGVVFAVSHLGSWESMSFFCYLTGHPTMVVVRPIRNPFIYQWAQSLRRLMNMIPVDKNNALKPLLKHLKQGKIAGILVDQWAGEEGIWETFFGRETSVTSLPAKIARKTGSPIVPIYCIRRGVEKFELNYGAPIEIFSADPDWEVQATRAINQVFEEAISRTPEQWTWFHRRWKEKPGTG